MRVFIVAKQRKPGKKLEDFDKEEGEAKDKARDRRRGDVDYTDFQHDPVLEDEYFGGFRPTDDRSEGSLKARPERAKVLFLLPVEQRGFSRYRQRSPGWADDRLWGLVDGQTPELYQFLTGRGSWPKWRKIKPQRATGNQVNFPFVHQAIRRAEQQRPTVTPERDRADELERQEKRQARLEEWTDPNAGPSAAFARGIRHEEYVWFLSRSIERRVQKLFNRQHKPSAKLEAKRLPVLKRVKANPRLTKEYLNRGLRSVKDARREFGEHETAKFLAKGGHLHFCLPEKTAKMLDKGGVRSLLSRVTQVGHTIWVTAVPSKKKGIAKRMGRPLVYERPMTAAERKARERAMQVKAPAPNRRIRPDAGRRPHPPPAASGSFFSEVTVRSLSSRVTRSGNMIHVLAVPTPRRSKEPLIGEIMISCKPRSENGARD